MKHYLLIAAMLLCGMQATAQREKDNDGGSISGSRAYEIIIEKVDKEDAVTRRNGAMRGLIQEQNSRGFFDSALGTALKTGYGSLASQKVVNMSTNLIDYTVNFIGTAIKNRKERFNNWYKTAKSYRQFSKTLPEPDNWRLLWLTFYERRIRP